MQGWWGQDTGEWKKRSVLFADAGNSPHGYFKMALLALWAARTPSPLPVCPGTVSLQPRLMPLVCPAHARARRSDAQSGDWDFFRLLGEVIWASCGPWLQQDYCFTSLDQCFNNIYLPKVHLISFLVKNNFPMCYSLSCLSRSPYRKWNSLIN